jgi:hypothetical protein
MSATDTWELIFLMFVLKLPIAYLIAVVVWAIRAEPEPHTAALVPTVHEPPPRPCPWHVRHRRATRPPRGGRRLVRTKATA